MTEQTWMGLCLLAACCKTACPRNAAAAKSPLHTVVSPASFAAFPSAAFHPLPLHLPPPQQPPPPPPRLPPPPSRLRPPQPLPRPPRRHSRPRLALPRPTWPARLPLPLPLHPRLAAPVTRHAHRRTPPRPALRAVAPPSRHSPPPATASRSPRPWTAVSTSSAATPQSPSSRHPWPTPASVFQTPHRPWWTAPVSPIPTSPGSVPEKNFQRPGIVTWLSCAVLSGAPEVAPRRRRPRPLSRPPVVVVAARRPPRTPLPRQAGTAMRAVYSCQSRWMTAGWRPMSGEPRRRMSVFKFQITGHDFSRDQRNGKMSLEKIF